MDSKTLIKQYVGIVQKIARVEHRRIPNHMIEYEELVSIGVIAIQTLTNKCSRINPHQCQASDYTRNMRFAYWAKQIYPITLD